MTLTWDELLSTKCFILNMDRSKDRWDIAIDRVKKAGFTNIERIRGFDKDTDDLDSLWKSHGSPKFRDIDGFPTNRGKQSCALGHYYIWQKIIQEKLEYAIVFEDDVMFHKDWRTLAPKFWHITPNFDVLYMGSSFDERSKYALMKSPCYCTHAMVITNVGAKKMYDICVNDPNGTWTIDIMLRKHMELSDIEPIQKLKWYVWNGWPWMDPIAIRSQKWQDRLKNSGLVFQDETMGSFVNV